MSPWHWQQLIGFKVFWLAAVVGGNQWILFCSGLLVAHFLASPTARKDIVVLPLALIGIAVDGLFSLAGVFYFEHAPLWLLVLWLGFVLTLHHGLHWLQSLPVHFAAIVGIFAGTASYFAGFKMGAVDFPLGIGISLTLIALCWAILLPLLIKTHNALRKML